MNNYNVLIHPETKRKINAYLKDLQDGTAQTGGYLQEEIGEKELTRYSMDEFLEALFRTKKPHIFAEQQVSGDGSDWNQEELSLLGEISVAVDVKVYDNGLHNNPKVFETPNEATLFYVPGALLRSSRSQEPADWEEVTEGRQIDFSSYYDLYKRRLLPPLFYANRAARDKGKQAFITIPGIGCGQFAGEFKGKLGEKLKEVLKKILREHDELVSHVKALYYDPYDECDNEREEIAGISFLVRPLTKGNKDKPQLCEPVKYEETGDDFSDCHLFSLVAWDHVSWPGNDFYRGVRETDDGVKSAATNSMAKITSTEGSYNTESKKYEPPEEYRNWEEVVKRNNLELTLNENLIVLLE